MDGIPFRDFPMGWGYAGGPNGSAWIWLGSKEDEDDVERDQKALRLIGRSARMRYSLYRRWAASEDQYTKRLGLQLSSEMLCSPLRPFLTTTQMEAPRE